MSSPSITRIDLKDFPGEEGIRIEKWVDGWRANDPPYQRYVTTNMTLAEMAAWLRAEGWTVFDWRGGEFLGIPDGARAFLGEPRSIRTKYQMKKRREEITRKAEEYFRTPESYRQVPPPLVGKVYAIDLAFTT